MSSEKDLDILIKSLLREKHEKPWIEFKHNNKEHHQIGEYISALSNSAAINGKPFGYLIYGIEDGSHKIVGTTFNFENEKHGGQDLQLWLNTQLDPNVNFTLHRVSFAEGDVVLIKIAAATHLPITFNGVAYIRIGSNKKKLKECPELERALWRTFDKTPFEKLIAIENLDPETVLNLLDYHTYFKLVDVDLPSSVDGIIEVLIQEKMVTKLDSGKFGITNLGAILFANKLSEFESLNRKAIRVIQYIGVDRTSASSEQVGGKGYAVGFEGLIEYVNKTLPKNEVIASAFRRDVKMYPEIAIRELIANAIIHQDFSVKGTGPMIEIFSDRIEITNPGTPLIDKDRFVDHPPISRNESLASFMRRIGACEERGSGFDKVVSSTEFFQLPAPDIDIYENHTKVCLYAHIPFSKMDKEDKIRACYLHACLRKVNKEYVTNSTLRERFKVDAKNSSLISRLLKDTQKAGLIKLEDEKASDKNKKYIPYWA